MTISKEVEKAIFAAAREITDSMARSAFLDQACGGQPGLRKRLARLLELENQADALFNANPRAGHEAEAVPSQPVAVVPPEEPGLIEPGKTMIGRYRLIERLGEGGCGLVYLAEQQEPVRRQLALKVIRLGLDTEQVIARFKAEQQALALMDHPNIARVFDAGTTDSGRPYFVMELVRGVKITRYCNENHLDVSRRLTLFVQVCQAIQHAHQKRIIHRDIKPSNILVELQDGVPQTKVIDFGIAKATGPQLTDNTQVTARDQFMGTPAYMSPEQADMGGGDVDTRSDIYSLGVLLYELLTGRTPFDSKEPGQAGMDEWRRILREREPQPPSAMLTVLGQTRLAEIASERHSEPLRLISTVRGDLDWIVMKALEKSPARRYETASALAADVLRYLANEPVEARPPSPIYRFQKLVRRNRVVFAAIAAVLIALVMGLGTSTWLFLQERQARQRAVEAEKQQIRLRQESDLLRQQAEFRERLTQAAVARSHDKLDEADRLVSGIPVPEQNMEYALVYRTVGDWHAFRGRWKQALERFSALMQVNQSDNQDPMALDYLRYGPLLLETGDPDGYQKFRELAVARFTGTTHPVAAERIIKVSLLTPADRDFLGRLQPLALIASNSLAGAMPLDDFGKAQAAWRAFSLALLEYRRGNYQEMKRWYQKSRQLQDFNDVRGVSFRILLAMSRFQQGATHQARAELVQIRQWVDGEFKRVEAPDAWSAFWFDWVFARILLREAMGMTSSAEP